MGGWPNGKASDFGSDSQKIAGSIPASLNILVFFFSVQRQSLQSFGLQIAVSVVEKSLVKDSTDLALEMQSYPKPKTAGRLSQKGKN